MHFSVFFYIKFVLQRVGLSAMTMRLKCTAFSVVEIQKFFYSDTDTEMCYTSGKRVAAKFSIKLATADLRGSDTDLL
jgi:hypothetical protein